MSRLLLWATFAAMLIPAEAGALDQWVPIAGNAQGGNFFRTDARVFNPSGTEDITITATYLPVNTDNSTAQGKTLTVKKREMLVFDNVVQSLFETGGFGAIRFSSTSDFVVTTRTFTDATCGAGGTFGQFIPAFDTAQAKVKGVILQLSTSSDLTTGFRSNIGFANVSSTGTTVSLSLWDLSGSKVADGTMSLLPFDARIVSIATQFGLPSLNLPAGYVTFTATQPVIGYGSVVDNRSADQIFIAASDDTGNPVPPANPDLQVTMTANTAAPQVGSLVTFTITVANVGEGSATALEIDDDLPAGLTFVSAAPNTGTFDSATGIWNVGPLTNAQSTVMQLTASANSGTTGQPLQNCARVSSSTPADTNAANDQGCATVTPVAAVVTKEFNISAHRFEYFITPTGGGSTTTDAFEVNKGDHVVLHITSSDVTHGFSMSPFVPSRSLQPGSTVTVEFDATQSGTFTFFCTVTCGSGHSGMNGKMTVKP